MKSVSSIKTHKAILKYLEVVPLPPGDNVFKWYMDNLSKQVGQLDLDCLFLHADEAVYSKLMIIKWLNEGLDDKIFRVLGGFHTLLVKLKIWHKKYGLLGMKDWCFIIMKVLENLTLDDTFTALIGKLRVDPSSVLAESVIAHPNFCNSKSAITATSEPYHPCL